MYVLFNRGLIPTLAGLCQGQLGLSLRTRGNASDFLHKTTEAVADGVCVGGFETLIYVFVGSFPVVAPIMRLDVAKAGVGRSEVETQPNVG